MIATFTDEHPTVDRSEGPELRAIGKRAENSQPAVEEILVARLERNKDDLIFSIQREWFQGTTPQPGSSIEKVVPLRIGGGWYDSIKVYLEGLFDKVVKDDSTIGDDNSTFSDCGNATKEFIQQRFIRLERTYSDSDGLLFRKQ